MTRSFGPAHWRLGCFKQKQNDLMHLLMQVSPSRLNELPLSYNGQDT
jgi:hypothetical protein